MNRVDYKIGEDWDLRFTPWDDIEKATDEEVVLQNFTFTIAEIASEYVGGRVTETDKVRIINQAEAEYLQRSTVDTVDVSNFDITENKLSFTVTIDSNTLSETVFI